ncbi:S-layer homology domain-containing protein [Butyricicoccus sp.]|uniref:S-layer homology domain-containing protein n=1 Tax=Butyricicoccus sp. TaxID=2049021 RepID=UPI003D7D4CE6
MHLIKKIASAAISGMILALGTVALAANVHVNTLSGSKQMILAETSSDSSSYATISAYEEIGEGNWVLKRKTASGRVGSNGIVPIESRKQGTKTTPEGIMRLQAAFGQTDNPGTIFPYHKITNNMYWDLNSGSKNYNRLVYSNPGGDYEQLIKYKTYKYMFTTDYNTEQIKGKGGAIFLHCNGSGATSGCVSMPEEDMKWCMTWLDPKKNPSLIVTTIQGKYKYLMPEKTSVTAAYIPDSGNIISWTDAAGAAQYIIQRADKPDGTYETIHTAIAGENTWTDTNGNKSDYYRVVTSNTIDGKTGFTVVSKNVSPQMPFKDVSYNAYYYDPVVWAAELGVTSGTSATTFSPENGCTRAQAVQMIYNYVGRPDTDDMEMSFADVPSDAWYADAVNWAFNVGVTSGTSSATFSPNDTCTRAQIVQMLWRQQGSERVAKKSNFTDVSADDWFYDAVNWAAEQHVTSGTSATTFSPRNMCTRGQIVTFLYKNFNR